MTLRTWIFGIAIAMAVAGAALIARSNQLPEWTNQAKMEEVASAPPPTFSGPRYDQYNEHWHERMGTLRTAKWPLFDLGWGLIALSLSLTVATVILGVKSRRDIANLRTPSRPLVILGVCVAAWIWLGGASSYGILQEQERFMFPPWADAIIIPMSGIALFTALGLILVAPLTWIIALRRAKLPASFWIWRPYYPLTSWFFSLCAGVSTLCGAVALYDALADGPYAMVPATILWVYGTLAVRAAALSQLPEPSSPQTV